MKIAQSELKEKLRKAYRSNDDLLFDRCVANLPCIPPQAVCYFQDGGKICAVFGDFVNLQESPAGFGATELEAFENLKLDWQGTVK